VKPPALARRSVEVMEERDVTAADEARIAYLAGQDVDSLSARERAALDDVRELLTDPAAWVQPHEQLEERIVAAIAAEAAARAAPAAPAVGDELRRRPRAGPSGPRLARLALAALAVAVAAVVAIVAGTDHGARPPLRFAMVVSGTALAPAAHGSATLTKTASGWEIVLSARGLPRLAGGRYFQAWLRNAAGVLVPVGTFDNARRRVTLWSGVSVTQYRTLTVTQQRADGDPAASGQRVLVGTIASPR
jgi:hypothetical protein